MVGIDGARCKLSAAYCGQPPMKYAETIKNLQIRYCGLLDLAVGMEIYKLQSPWMEIYHKHFLPKYGWDIHKKLTNFTGVLQFENDLFYIVNGDYEGPDIYRNEVSCSRHIEKIEIPTFLYFSLDDPLIGTNSIEFDKCLHNPNIILSHTKYGGHCCCFESFLSSN